jgi:hypothetical protein
MHSTCLYLQVKRYKSACFSERRKTKYNLKKYTENHRRVTVKIVYTLFYKLLNRSNKRKVLSKAKLLIYEQINKYKRFTYIGILTRIGLATLSMMMRSC